MNFVALQTFLTAVECGNLNKAAERLNVTQSTVTARLDALETALNQNLLIRSRKGTQLTRAGFIFRPHAEALLRAWDQSRDAIDIPYGYTGLFSFACELTIWDGVGHAFFSKAREENSEMAFEAWPGSPDEIRAWLSNGITDTALTLDPATGYGLISREFCQERLIQVVAPEFGPRQTYVYVDLGADFRRQHTQAGLALNKGAVSYASVTWALDHLKSEGGRCYLPEPMAAPLIKSGALQALEDAPVFTRTLYITNRETAETAFPWLPKLVSRFAEDEPLVREPA